MGFVLNLDEILFAAVVPLSRKKWNRRAGALVAAPNRFADGVMRFFMSGAVGKTMFIALPCYAVLFWDWTRYQGKFDRALALDCICEISGETCVAAHLLGGYSSLKSTPGYQR